MRNTAFFVTGLVLILVQNNLFRVISFIHVPGLVPSLVLPLILFMGVHEYSLARGASVAFVLGYATDLVGIAPVGLYTFYSPRTLITDSTRIIEVASTYKKDPSKGATGGSEIIWSLDSTVQNREFGSPGIGPVPILPIVRRRRRIAGCRRRRAAR